MAIDDAMPEHPHFTMNDTPAYIWSELSLPANALPSIDDTHAAMKPPLLASNFPKMPQNYPDPVPVPISTTRTAV
jgi:hypothetical protein